MYLETLSIQVFKLFIIEWEFFIKPDETFKNNDQVLNLINQKMTWELT